MKTKKKILRRIALLVVSVMLLQSGFNSVYAAELLTEGAVNVESTEKSTEPITLDKTQKQAEGQGESSPVPTESTEGNKTVPTEGNETVPTESTEGNETVPTESTEGNETVPTESTEGNETVPTESTEGNETVPTESTGETETVPTEGTGENETVPTEGTGENETVPTEETTEGQEAESELPMEESTIAQYAAKAKAVNETNGGIQQWGPNNGPANKEGTHIIIGWYEPKQSDGTIDTSQRPASVAVTVYWKNMDGTTHVGIATLNPNDKTTTDNAKTNRNLGADSGYKDVSIDRWKTWPNYKGSKENLQVTFDFPDIDGYKKQLDGDCGVIYIKEIPPENPDEKPKVGTITINKTTVGDVETPSTAKFHVIDFNTKEEVATIPYSKLQEKGGSYTVTGLPLGTYLIRESGAEVEGYVLTVKGSKAGHNDIDDESNYEENSGPEASANNNNSNHSDVAYITNTYTAATTSIALTAKKTFAGSTLEGGEFQFEIKEGSVKICTATNDAKGDIVFPKIYYNKAGTYNYTIREVPGTLENVRYDNSVHNVTVKVEPNDDGGLTATADYPEKGVEFVNESLLMDISGTKTWEDNNDQDGKRPGSITVNLLAGDEIVDSQSVTAANQWSYSFENKPKYADGQEIRYTITENAVDGYTSEISGDAVNGFVITNTHEPATIDIEGSKTWEDNNNQDGNRPNSITVNLLANSEIIESQSVTADDEGNWNYSFENKPKYADGQEIRYTITENAVDGYTSEISGDAENGFVITNTHEPATIDIEGSKTWEDNNNQDGKRPESITVNLLANGEKIDSQTVTAGQDGNWEYSFKELPKYKEGTEIIYTVSEEAVPGYLTTISEYNIVNTATSVKISKVDIADGKELEGATIQILDKEGKVVAEWTSTKGAHEVRGLKTGETYTLRETVAPNGYEITTDTVFVLDESGQIDRSQTTTTVSEDGILLVEDQLAQGSITVTKKVTLKGEPIKLDVTYYVALFRDEAGTDRCSDIKALDIKFKSEDGTATVTFENLPCGTYYVHEVEKDGSLFAGNDRGIEVIASVQNATITLTPSNRTGAAVITNDYQSEPREEYTTVEPKEETSESESEKETEAAKKTETKAAVKTGDTTNIMIYVIMMLAAVGCVGGVFFDKRKRIR